MTLRWCSHRHEQHEKDRIERKAEGRLRSAEPQRRQGAEGTPQGNRGSMAATPRG